MNQKAARYHLERVLSGELQLSANNAFYDQSYKALIELGANVCGNGDGLDVLALAHAVYGWMPTILKNYELEVLATMPVARVKAIKDIGCAIELLDDWLPSRPPINNSWVGTSKMLHFLNPEVFAIWDRRVAGRFEMKAYSLHRNRKHYLEYLKFCHEFMKAKASDLDHYRAAHMPNVSRLRALELIMFLTTSPDSPSVRSF
jgi:hypothetical protein